MGRKRQKRVLDVYIGKSKVGQLMRIPNGAVSFRTTVLRCVGASGREQMNQMSTRTGLCWSA